MRKVVIGAPPFPIATSSPEVQWLAQGLNEIQRASHDQITEEIADAYTLSNITVTRTLDPTTATTADIANVLATLLQDMKARGVKRG
jgi:hypothetical protein